MVDNNHVHNKVRKKLCRDAARASLTSSIISNELLPD